MMLNRYLLTIFVLIISIGLVENAIAVGRPLTDTLNRHNFSSAATHGSPHAQPPGTGGTDQICIFCHTPHSASPASTLWSRPGPDTALTFILYGGDLVIKGQLGAPAGAQDRSQYKVDGSVTYPSGASRLCLSCHDGATAIGLLRDSTTIAMVGAQDLVTNVRINAIINLSTSHPISFVYDTAVHADVEAVYGIGNYQLPPSGDNVDTPLDGENKMQCTTCHDPHNDTRDAGLPPFWRHETLVDSGTYSDVYEEVCGQCHIGGITAGSEH